MFFSFSPTIVNIVNEYCLAADIQELIFIHLRSCYIITLERCHLSGESCENKEFFLLIEVIVMVMKKILLVLISLVSQFGMF